MKDFIIELIFGFALGVVVTCFGWAIGSYIYTLF